MRDFYRNLVIDKLLRYEHAKSFIESSSLEIKELESKKDPKIIGSYGLSVGKASHDDIDVLLNINAKIDLLKNNREENLRLVKSLDRAMVGMSESEKDITVGIYGSRKRDSRIYDLCKKYKYEKSQLYRIANDGLRHISLKLYGSE